MRVYCTQLLLSMSLATVTFSAPSAVQTPVAVGRNKRSFFTDHGQKHVSRQHMNAILRKAKLAKRSDFDHLDLDMLLNDPFFMELEAEHEKDGNNFNVDEGLFSLDNGLGRGFESAMDSGLHNDIGSGLHSGVESNLHKGVQNGLESGLQNGLENGLPNRLDNGMPNGLANGLPIHSMRPPKDEMSNVIPGAQGPYDSAPSRHSQDIADNMMDEFMNFLTLKELGLLDSCLGVKRR